MEGGGGTEEEERAASVWACSNGKRVMENSEGEKKSFRATSGLES